MPEQNNINDAEIYYALLEMIADIEEINEITIVDVPDIRSALDRLELAVKYLKLDLEATRRERDGKKK